MCLEENSIKTINNDFFKGSQKLRNLELGDNGLLQLPDLQWIRHSLVKLHAAANDLNSIDTFNKIGIFERLSSIDVYSNNIRNFNVSLWRQMPELTNFQISLNKLTYIDDFRSFYEKEIGLLGKPWHCGAALSWMGEENTTFEFGLTCATPDCLHGTAVAAMSKYNKAASYTEYPKKYAHGFCFAVLCCGYTLTDFPISIRLTSLALWQSNDCPSASKATLINMDKYFMWIHYERLHNHNKAKHNKTVCTFLGIYCTAFDISQIITWPRGFGREMTSFFQW